jgi:DNA-binding IclR family transcriptional regulator
MRNVVPLSTSEATCLEALRSGVERKVLIALRVGLNLEQTKLALERLASLDLVVTNGYRAWHVTPRGKVADISIVPPTRRSGRPPATLGVPGASAGRMLALLDRPRHGAELAALLGVTRQRVHQLVVALSIRGLIRSADPNYPTFVIARMDDPSTLLEQDQERVLSAFPETKATTLSKIALATQRPISKIFTIAEFLLSIGLIEKTGTVVQRDMYRLTAMGAAHWQRSTTARHADIPPLPFRSDRVFGVLSHLASQGPTRTRDVGLALGIPQTSINALMQWLKRKKVVRTQTDAPRAPYELTPDGLEMVVAKKAAIKDRAGMAG